MSSTPPPASPTMLAPFSGLSGALSVLRAPFSMSVITVLAPWLPEQVREVYRVLVQRGSDSQVADVQWQWTLAAGALLLLAIVLWQVARELILVAAADEDLERKAVAKALLDWAPRLLATAPFIFVPNKRYLLDPEKVPALKSVLLEADNLQRLQQLLSDRAKEEIL